MSYSFLEFSPSPTPLIGAKAVSLGPLQAKPPLFLPARGQRPVLFGSRLPVLAIEKLISAKRAAGRTKDRQMIPDLEAIQEHIKGQIDESKD